MEIPKIFHHIWVGEEDPSELLVACRESFLRHHPEWEFKYWHKDELQNHKWPIDLSEELTFENEEYKFCDALRLAILSVYGGFYIDHDMYCVKSFDDMTESLSVIYGEYLNGHGIPSFSNAVIGAEANDPSILEALQKTSDCLLYGTTNMLQFSRVMVKYNHHPQSYRKFFPHNWTEAERCYEIFPETYTIHLWHKTMYYDLEKLNQI